MSRSRWELYLERKFLLNNYFMLCIMCITSHLFLIKTQVKFNRKFEGEKIMIKLEQLEVYIRGMNYTRENFIP